MTTGGFEFSTLGPAGTPATPDAAPTVGLLVNGVPAAAFTVAAQSAGVYVASAAVVPASAPHAAVLTAKVASYAFAGVPAGPRYKDLGVVDLGGVFEFGQARAGGPSAVTLKAAATSAALANRATVRLVTGPGAGQTARVTAYDAVTKVATVDAPWAQAPTSATFYAVQWFSPGALLSAAEILADPTHRLATRFDGSVALPNPAPAGYGGSGGSGGGSLDVAALFATVLDPGDPGTYGRLQFDIMRSYGAVRYARVAAGTNAANRLVRVLPFADGGPLPTAGMVRNPPLRIALVTGGQAVQKAQVTAWLPQPDGVSVLITLNQPWPVEPAVDDAVMIY